MNESRYKNRANDDGVEKYAKCHCKAKLSKRYQWK
jgi:hypothetical protein